MAQKIVTIYTDDLTGEESHEASTHTLVLDGVAYEMDLTPDSYDKLLEAVAPFMRGGRRTGRGHGKAAKPRTGGRSNDTAEIRTWAKKNHLAVNDRGRVPKKLREAYEAAH
ncbi:Lsr2 family protein [Streptomyces sp. NPDC003038]|uniref:histone-like nucleoid-structuring protein Lsr2 n=1 Tax=Streptomyces sp. NPDC003038 TaxID=3154546 RepID=UPI0033BCC686